tara:strand:+ start:807 stop:1295 length:489 start_codon:yes stop_codon:yes gene_type:complete
MEQRDLDYVIEAHRDFPTRGFKAFRKWDQKTPYHTHPIWCAAMLATETTLDESVRKVGSQVLLYHDVLEDTTRGLPPWLSEPVVERIDMMTYQDILEEIEKIWDCPREIRLFKLYDKVENLLSWQESSIISRERYKLYAEALRGDVFQNYGELNITKIAGVI